MNHIVEFGNSPCYSCGRVNYHSSNCAFLQIWKEKKLGGGVRE